MIVSDIGAANDAVWIFAAGAATAPSPIGRYAACLASLVLAVDDEAGGLAESLAGERFPPAVAAALGALASGADDDYRRAVSAVLGSFETRKRFLEGIPVADTVLALQALAEKRGIAAELTSPLLPERPFTLAG